MEKSSPSIYRDVHELSHQKDISKLTDLWVFPNDNFVLKINVKNSLFLLSLLGLALNLGTFPCCTS